MFIYSLPVFFTYIRLVSPIEGLIIFWGLFAVVFITSPSVQSDYRQLPFTNYLFSAWIGSISLGRVFWPFFLLLNGVLYGIDWLAKTGNFTVSSWDDVHFILLLPIVWWTTGVWRCSANTHFRIWVAAARLMTLCVFLEYALKLYIRIYYPRIFFNCEDLLLDYGNCF